MENTFVYALQCLNGTTNHRIPSYIYAWCSYIYIYIATNFERQGCSISRSTPAWLLCTPMWPNIQLHYTSHPHSYTELYVPLRLQVIFTYQPWIILDGYLPANIETLYQRISSWVCSDAQPGLVSYTWWSANYWKDWLTRDHDVLKASLRSLATYIAKATNYINSYVISRNFNGKTLSCIDWRDYTPDI